MIDGTFTVRPGNKDIVFAWTDTERIFKILNLNCIVNNKLIPKVVKVPASYLAAFYARFRVKPAVKLRDANNLRIQKGGGCLT